MHAFILCYDKAIEKSVNEHSQLGVGAGEGDNLLMHNHFNVMINRGGGDNLPRGKVSLPPSTLMYAFIFM